MKKKSTCANQGRKKKKALIRAAEKLRSGCEVDTLKEEFTKMSPEQNGMITSTTLILVAEGLSQIEIKSMLGVGGHRVSRLQKKSKYTEEELEEKQEKVPCPHACSDADHEAVKDSIGNFDIEPGYPCAHRQTLMYFADPTIDWTSVYKVYVKNREEAASRILSFGRWRDYVRVYYPNLRLKRFMTDMCNRCYRIDIQLRENISDERKAQLIQEKQTHLRKYIKNCFY